MGKSRICFAFVEQKFGDDAEHERKDIWRWRWRYQKASATSVSTVCGSGWSSYVGLSSMDSCATRTPSICCSSLGRTKFADFRRPPLFVRGGRGQDTEHHSPVRTGSHRTPVYSRITVHRAVLLVTATQQWRKNTRRGRFHETKEKLRCSPSLSLLREFRTCIRDDAPAHGSTIHEAITAVYHDRGHGCRNLDISKELSKLRRV